TKKASPASHPASPSYHRRAYAVSAQRRSSALSFLGVGGGKWDLCLTVCAVLLCFWSCSLCLSVHLSVQQKTHARAAEKNGPPCDPICVESKQGVSLFWRRLLLLLDLLREKKREE